MSGPTIPSGMVPWQGGDSTPSDWDGGAVLRRDGGYWDGHCRWWNIPGPSDIIAYTPTQPTTPVEHTE